MEGANGVIVGPQYGVELAPSTLLASASDPGGLTVAIESRLDDRVTLRSDHRGLINTLFPPFPLPCSFFILIMLFRNILEALVVETLVTRVAHIVRVSTRILRQIILQIG